MLLAGERKSRGLHLWPGLMAMEFRGWVGGLGLLLTVSQEPTRAVFFTACGAGSSCEPGQGC